VPPLAVQDRGGAPLGTDVPPVPKLDKVTYAQKILDIAVWSFGQRRNYNEPGQLLRPTGQSRRP